MNLSFASLLVRSLQAGLVSLLLLLGSLTAQAQSSATPAIRFVSTIGKEKSGGSIKVMRVEWYNAYKTRHKEQWWLS